MENSVNQVNKTCPKNGVKPLHFCNSGFSPPKPPPILRDMEIKVIPVGPYAMNCSIIWKSDGLCLIIDPGYDIDQIEQAIENEQLKTHFSKLLLVYAYIHTTCETHLNKATTKKNCSSS